jgi:hypothetical protein
MVAIAAADLANAHRRSAVDRELTSVHASPVYQECLRELRDISLYVGYQRPARTRGSFGQQDKAIMPGDATFATGVWSAGGWW